VAIFLAAEPAADNVDETPASSAREWAWCAGWQRGPGVSASPGEPPATAVSGGSSGQQLARTRESFENSTQV